jgi:glucan phosphoethanolaminetransferase (alkaline phosphatase superfamily)
MIDALRDLPAGQLALVVCLVFVGLTWVGALFIRPFLRLFVCSHPDLNSLLGNFVSIYWVFYGILMGLLAVAAYQNKVEVEQAISSEVTSAFALFRNVSAYPESVRRPLQESVRDYVRFAIEGE